MERGQVEHERWCLEGAERVEGQGCDADPVEDADGGGVGAGCGALRGEDGNKARGALPTWWWWATWSWVCRGPA